MISKVPSKTARSRSAIASIITRDAFRNWNVGRSRHDIVDRGSSFAHQSTPIVFGDGGTVGRRRSDYLAGGGLIAAPSGTASTTRLTAVPSPQYWTLS